MLNKDEYFKTVRRPYPPLFASTIMEGYYSYNVNKEFVPKPYRVHDLLIQDGYWYYPTKDFEIARQLAFNFWNNSKNLTKIKKMLQAREKALIESTKKDFVAYTKAYANYMPALLFVYAIESPVTDRIKDLLRRKIGIMQTEKLMSDLNIPIENNLFIKEEYDLVTSKDLKKHVKEYGWIYSRYGEIKPYTLSQAKNKLKKTNKNAFLNNLVNQRTIAKKAVNYAKSLLSVNNRVIVDLMQYIIYYRTQRTDIINKSQYLYYPALKKIAASKKISYMELLHCTKQEVLTGLPEHKILKQRLKDHATVLDNGRIYCVTAKESGKIRKLLKEDTKSVIEIKGNVACAGLVRGRARIIIGTKDFDKVKRRDILITSMTNPHMVPIMNKAAAFVTDEGGITCHAAIMSRELKKPCIIGTQIATKVFKDGDMVEVDANKGIVRKIK